MAVEKIVAQDVMEKDEQKKLSIEMENLIQ
jgi:hypothetical protein